MCLLSFLCQPPCLLTFLSVRPCICLGFPRQLLFLLTCLSDSLCLLTFSRQTLCLLTHLSVSSCVCLYLIASNSPPSVNLCVCLIVCLLLLLFSIFVSLCVCLSYFLFLCKCLSVRHGGSLSLVFGFDCLLTVLFYQLLISVFLISPIVTNYNQNYKRVLPLVMIG